MEINGLIKLTLLDFPGKTACTVFFNGCNFRCPFCHNASLVRGEGEHISEEEFFSFLKKRQGILDGVAITGGEPLLQPKLEDFIKKIKKLGFLVKLDTNGSLPDKLISLCNSGMVDYVAMDVKSSAEGYMRAVGTDADIAKIRKSIDFLIFGKVDYELRTTAVKGIVEREDFKKLAAMIQGAKKYFIQQFVNSGDILGSGGSAYSEDEMNEILTDVRQLVPSAALRGI